MPDFGGDRHALNSLTFGLHFSNADSVEISGLKQTSSRQMPGTDFQPKMRAEMIEATSPQESARADGANELPATRDKTWRLLKAILEPLHDGPRLYEFMINCPDQTHGTIPGKQYSLGVTDEGDVTFDSYRSVLSWKVRDDGSVDLVRVGRRSEPLVLRATEEPDEIDPNAKVISVRPFSFADELGPELAELAALAAEGGFSGLKLEFPHLTMEVDFGAVPPVALHAEDD